MQTIRDQIAHILNRHERYQGCYFWSAHRAIDQEMEDEAIAA